VETCSLLFCKNRTGEVDVRGSVHHSTIHEEKFKKVQRCIKTLFTIYVKLNMFWATHRPSSGAQNCTGSLFFIRGRLLDMWSVDNVHRPHVQQPSMYEKPQAARAVLGS
jgi:hypothetical protein